MTQELKPCPFCGGKAVVMPEDFVISGYWIRCSTCGVEQKNTYIPIDDAIAAWNRRATDDQVQS